MDEELDFEPPIVRKLADSSVRSGADPDSIDGAAIVVRARATIVSGERKRAEVAHEHPAGSVWEIFSDEGQPLGGEDRAPEPLSFLAAAGAFCVLTQISQYAKANKLVLGPVSVEQTYYYEQSGAWRNRTRSGRAFKVTNTISIESDEPSDRITEMVETAEQACFVEQSLVSSVPIATEVIFNGESIAELSM